eukprot:CAMPEP_0176480050 /NCGR_PEP_ID=MMETSP0200_2-20121128/2070_1 /TAXON_ID=947934 /ORGANISM="Chaetoceros sp., Strain GSL56" /LENGTH=498 /DNA_ID=CAMNT_0017876143 /DNA_START=294 /DNA_END=1790 /DNA_ORIENTATION=+
MNRHDAPSKILATNRRFHGQSPALFLSSKNDRQDSDDEEEYDDDDDDDDDDDSPSLYEQSATSEFTPSSSSSSSSSIRLRSSSSSLPIDWGGEYDTLRSRIQSTKEGNVGPSQALFRILSSESPNEAIMNFVSSANPEVVSSMSSAVSGLLGSLASPMLGGIGGGGGGGVETIVKANGETLGKLCFQLQMTGYMFRNAEYVLALRELMDIGKSADLEDYRRAFEKLDRDGSGYIEREEVKDLLVEVYGGEEELPSFEVQAFVKFFDSNGDGRISWDEFEKGLGVMADQKKRKNVKSQGKDKRMSSPGALTSRDEDDDDEEDDDTSLDFMGEPTVSGMIEVEMKNGKVIQVEAKEYIQELKREAEALKSALRRESGMVNDKPPSKSSQSSSSSLASMSSAMDPAPREAGGISSYIASLQGDIQSLTKGISPEVVEAMRLLVNFVLDGGTSGKGKERKSNQQLEMEIPGSALQQLALWQLVLGYKLREAEATGEYKKMLE